MEVYLEIMANMAIMSGSVLYRISFYMAFMYKTFLNKPKKHKIRKKIMTLGYIT